MGNRNTSENSSNNCYISQLPNEVLVHIFTYLDPADFGRCAQVCKHWQPLIYDECYWCNRLLNCHGVRKFSNLAEQVTNDSSSTVEEIFDPIDFLSSRLICCMRQRGVCPVPSNNQRPIRLLFFGLGIAANRISRAILTGKNSSFEALSLIAGNCNGVGGGVVVKFKGRHLIHVITLYTNIKAVRENPGDPVRKDLFSKWLTSSGDNSKPPTLLPSIQEVVRSVDCFVYTSNNDFMRKDNTWLSNAEQCLSMIVEEAALNENSQCRRPLLHLSCSTAALSENDINLDQVNRVDRDQMKRFPRPWNVCKVDLELLNEIEHGFNWLVYVTLKQQNQLMTNY